MMKNEEQNSIYNAVFKISQGNFDLFDQMSREFAESVKKGTDNFAPPPVSPPAEITNEKAAKRKAALP